MSLIPQTKAHVLITSLRTRDKGVGAAGGYSPPGAKYLHKNLLVVSWIEVVVD